MNFEEKQQILQKAQDWFNRTIAENHIKNTKRLTNPDSFNINPFTTIYLANFLTGNSKPESIAKALIYPRVLGTSITTSFGTNIQKFTNEVLDGFGSTTSGIDIEFIDQIDGYRKFCQMKSGPDTINKDDVETISGHFSKVIKLAHTNNLRIAHSDMIVGVLYGQESDLNAHYKRITKEYHYPVFVGQHFWHRLTGDENFYAELISSLGSVASQANFSNDLENIISELAESPTIQNLSKINE